MSTDGTDETQPLPAADETPTRSIDPVPADEQTPTETLTTAEDDEPRPATRPLPTAAAPAAPRTAEGPTAPPTAAVPPPPAPAPATPAGPELRVGTVVWGLVVAVVGVGIVSFAWGARIDGGLALIVLLAGAGVALLVGSLLVAVRHPHRRDGRG